jgi:hypothetical protein
MNIDVSATFRTVGPHAPESDTLESYGALRTFMQNNPEIENSL